MTTLGVGLGCVMSGSGSLRERAWSSLPVAAFPAGVNFANGHEAKGSLHPVKRAAPFTLVQGACGPRVAVYNHSTPPSGPSHDRPAREVIAASIALAGGWSVGSGEHGPGDWV